MKKLIPALAMAVALVFLSDFALLAVGGKNTEYVGGTISSIKEGTEGTSSATSETVFVFQYNKSKIEIPYDRINSLEYGQKAGRRVGVAIMISPLALFSKKRRHFLTLGFLDANDKQQAAVFEVGKDVIRVTLATLEARSGKKIEYQDEEARKNGAGGD